MKVEKSESKKTSKKEDNEILFVTFKQLMAKS